MNDTHNLMIVEHLGWDMFAKILEENLTESRCGHSFKRKTRLASIRYDGLWNKRQDKPLATND